MDKFTTVDSSTTLRPRVRRQIHEYDTDLPEQSQAKYFDGSTSVAASPRSLHPKPDTRHSGRNAGSSESSNRVRAELDTTEVQRPSSVAAPNAWGTSWSSLQGLASSILRINSPGGTINHEPHNHRHLPHQNRHTSCSREIQPVQWGPPRSREQHVGIGTCNDRRAQSQAKKREALFAANGSLIPDDNGIYKRRNSDDKMSTAIGSDESSTLVYIHRVKTTDTLAGISIRFKCEPHTIRKHNRLWPNDSIQIREVVYLPVNACGLRGRRIPATGKDQPDLDGSGNESRLKSQQCQSRSPWDDNSDLTSTQARKPGPSPSTAASTSSFAATSNFEEPSWVHDSWVEIDSFSEAVEIVRLNPKSGGYYARGRRKSLSSDPGDPPMSLDSPRLSHQSSSVRSDAHNVSPGHRNRSGSSSHVAKSLRGPGGVGTMKTNVRSPGPAQDGLNKLFGAHLPDVNPHISSDALETYKDVVPHDYSGIENVSGVIEGWVRKFANKASASMRSPSLMSKTRTGDLIELSEDAFQLTEDVENCGINEDRSRQIAGEYQDTTWQTEQVPRKRLSTRATNLDQVR